MESERQRRIEELFHSALRVPASQRSRLLQRACPDDVQIRSEVESLLAYESSADDFIEIPAFQVAAGLMAQDEDIASPTRPDARYRLLEKLGGGGMGVVYKADDTRLRRTVAIKLLPFEIANNAISLERFQREAQAASALNHPNICTVYDAGESDGRPFIAMELLEGETLEQRLEGKPLPVEEMLRLAIQITDALEAAHDRGIIHRDIKPSNIFITSKGEAKILDFGVAKLQGTESSEPAVVFRAQTEALSNITLTGAGEAVGTATYMSPEQIRGEKLDSRTDLFSFGLVLHEMATGKRAFAGDTTPAVQRAILEQTPAPIRMLAPGVPGRLEKIVSKVLQKDRAARYQSASELRSDLRALQKDLKAIRRWAKWLAAGVVAFLAIVGVLWIVRQRASVPPTLRALRQRQLTANSSENQIKSGAISPDGKYLAYSDLSGIHLKVLETGKATTVPQPEGVPPSHGWEVGPWLPDSTGFMASTSDPALPPGYWSVSVSGGPPRQVRDDINPWSYSPDGRWLAVTLNEDLSSVGGSEIWIMRPDGSQARKVYEAANKTIFRWITWPPNGKRLAYVRDQAVSGNRSVTIESRKLDGTSPVTMLSSADLDRFDSLPPGEQQFLWLPDGRLIYEKAEPGDDCPTNLFEARISNDTGAVRERPKQVTDWAGFCVFGLTSTTDGKRLTFMRQTQELPIFTGEFDPLSRVLSVPSRLTLTEERSFPVGWTRDSKAVLFISKQAGKWGIYKQGLGTEAAEPLVTGLQQSPVIAVTNDSLLYLHSGSANAPGIWILTRIPFRGGLQQELLRGHFDGFECDSSDHPRCVVSELTGDKKEIVFTAMDPAMGLGRELARFRDEHAQDLYWHLSPEGKRIALVKQFEGRIRLLSLEHQAVRQIDIKGGAQLRPFSWSADGKGFFASVMVQQGADLAYVDLQGVARSLWERRGQNVFIIPSPAPDGRHIAIGASRQTTNLWMIDGF